MQNLALKTKPQKVFFKTTCYLATFEDKTLILFLLEVAGCLLYLATNLLPFRFFKNKPLFCCLYCKNKVFTLRKKLENMSKKPVTIPQVDEDVYTALKNKAAEQKQSVSELVNELMSSYVEGNNNTLDNSDELDSLRSEREQLKSELASFKAKQEETAAEKDKLTKQLSILQVENAKAKEIITQLETAKQKWEEHYNEAKNANETLTAMRANTVQVELSELEFALINYVAEKEQKRRRNDVTITPALLLKTMFVEYCLNGETWFFPFPKRSEIKALKEKLKKQEE